MPCWRVLAGSVGGGEEPVSCTMRLLASQMKRCSRRKRMMGRGIGMIVAWERMVDEVLGLKARIIMRRICKVMMTAEACLDGRDSNT